MPHDPAAADLHELLMLGLSRGGHLLAAGERVVIDRVLGLSEGAARAHALLTARRTEAWPLDDLRLHGLSDEAAAIAELVGAQLADHIVPWRLRAELLPRAALADACAALDLPRSGKRAELAARLAGRVGWRPGRWLRIRHRALITRLERWAMMRRHPDRAALVVERLGHVRWPAYTLTRGPALHRDRGALLAWERLLHSTDLDAIAAGVRAGHHRAPGRLDLTRTLRERLLEQGRALERAERHGEARARYLAAVELLGADAAVRVARTLELEGRPDLALDHLLQAQADRPRLAVERAGRRLARSLRQAWPPAPPLDAPPRRSVRLVADGRDGPRPLYRAGDRALPVEAAVVAALGALGRRALHVEGALWTTLAALLLAECYFLPVFGALPVRFLDGPLDLGTPAFRQRRADAVDAVLAAVRAGDGPRRILEADARWRGVRLAGASFAIASGPELAAIADGLGGHALAAVTEELMARGWRAAAGLPDLVVLPGADVALPGALPSRIGPGLLLAEVKGPTDALRDEQRRWMHRLDGLRVPIELWEVSPTTVATGPRRPRG